MINLKQFKLLNKKMSNKTNEFKITKKQAEALRHLTDDQRKIILFWGGAGWWKSFLWWLWIATMCINYPGVKYLMARKIKEQVKKTTLDAFFKATKALGIERNKHYFYTENRSEIRFANWSTILLMGIMNRPSDKDFDSLGSLELTWAFVDEAAEVVQKAIWILSARCWRHLNDKYKIPPKVLLTCNPSRNWLYKDFFIPHKNGNLKKSYVFIQSLYKDNPHLTQENVNNILALKDMDELSYYRYIGDWEKAEDSWKLYSSESIANIFINKWESWTKYLSVDVSWLWRDKTVITYFDWRIIKKIWTEEKTNQVELSERIKNICSQFNISLKNVVIDTNWIWQWIWDILDQIPYPYKSQNRPMETKDERFITQFINLRAQNYYNLKQLIENWKIWFEDEDPSKFDLLQEELEQIIQVDIDKWEKFKIISKDKIKQNIWRSTDFADTIAMRNVFDLIDKTEEKFDNNLFDMNLFI